MSPVITKSEDNFIISYECLEVNPRLCIKNKLVNNQQTLVFIGPIKIKFKYKFLYPIARTEHRVSFFIPDSMIGIWTIVYCDGKKEIHSFDMEIE